MQAKPIFDKRLFKAQVGITISKQAKEILLRDASKTRSEVDLHAIRSVVCGLKEIHKNFEFVKAALGCASTYEEQESDIRIEDTGLSCYYILSGSVEAFYQVKNTSAGKGCMISYIHVAGDYIGLVSSDGARFDLPSPESMTTNEQCKFIRINRVGFHDKIQQAQKQFRDEITRFLDHHSIFDRLNDEDRSKLISQMAKQEFPAGKEILSQGKKQEHAFFIAEGRCRYYRRIFLPEQRRSELFNVGYVEKGSYFDPSCILDDQTSKFSVIAVGHVTCYLLNKWTIKNSESLLKALSVNRPQFQSDKNIECFMKESDEWQSYKRDIVSDVLAQKQRSASRIIPQHCVPRILSRAITHGTALRHRRRQKMFYLPQQAQNLDHHSHEGTGSGETKSLLKAILLMRKSRGSIHKERENDVKEEYKDGFTEKHARLINNNMKLENKPKTSEGKTCNNKISSSERKVIDVTQSSSSPDVNNTQSIKCRSLEDRWVTNDRRFVIKEVVNTRIPGKSSPGPEAYRRFAPSMFESLDKIMALDKKKVVDSFGGKTAANTWVKNTKENLKSGQNYYNPGPSPIIIIEKYNETDYVDDDDDDETGNESCDNQEENVQDVCEGSLETLIEDIEKENMVENINKDEWWTAVHETRYESEQCLEKAKQDIAELEQELVKLGWSRETLLAKERKKRENRMKSGCKKNEVKTEKSLPVKLENETKNGRKKRYLKRQDSIQKLLEERTLDRPSRSRGRHSFQKDEHVKPATLTKHYSASSLFQSTKHFQGRLRPRTSSIS